MTSKTLNDKQVIALMHKHQGFREAIRRYRSDLPLMSDEEFLKEFRKICPTIRGCVTGVQVAQIYQLRAKYEMLPPGKNGYSPKYGSTIVRIQMRDNLIRKLDPDELEAMFNVRKMPVNWYWLEDVLKIKLGRWPAESREMTESDILRWWRPEEKRRGDAKKSEEAAPETA